MKAFIEPDLEQATEDNHDFRRVIHTGNHLQLVLMSLLPGEEIGDESHATHDQFFRIEKGKGTVSIDGVESKVGKNSAIIVPAGTRHNIANTGDKPMRLYTLYAPPQHRDGFVAPTRDLAEASNETFDRPAQP